MDYRGAQMPITLDRQAGFRQRGGSVGDIISRHSELAAFVKNLFDEHLQRRGSTESSNLWMYVQRMIDLVPYAQFWRSREGTTRIVRGDENTFVSVDNLAASSSVTLSSSLRRLSVYRPSTDFSEQLETDERSATEELLQPAMTQADLNRLASATRTWIFGERVAVWASVTTREVITLRFDFDAVQPTPRKYNLSEVDFCPISNFEGVGVYLDRPNGEPGKLVLLNSAHKLIAWLSTAKELCQGGVASLDESAYERLVGIIAETVGYGLPDNVRKLDAFLENWRALPGVDQSMHPPYVHSAEYRQVKFELD
jgi:hypothetical protein